MDECVGSPSPVLAGRRMLCSSLGTRGGDTGGCQQCTRMVECGRSRLRGRLGAREGVLGGVEQSPKVEIVSVREQEGYTLYNIP